MRDKHNPSQAPLDQTNVWNSRTTKIITEMTFSSLVCYQSLRFLPAKTTIEKPAIAIFSSKLDKQSIAENVLQSSFLFLHFTNRVVLSTNASARKLRSSNL